MKKKVFRERHSIETMESGKAFTFSVDDPKEKEKSKLTKKKKSDK